jgi:hypothetical protein
VGAELFITDSAASIQALLGNYDSDRTNDITTRLGESLGANPTIGDLYSNYAESWRITQDESLFDYFDGDTTDTYTDRTFPDAVVNSSSLPQATRDEAEAICRSNGVLDAVLLEACTLDVGMTGDATFAVAPSLIAPPADSLGSAILREDFEDGTLDPRISASTVNVPLFPPTASGAGIKDTTALGGAKAYGFGLSGCGSDCFDNFRSVLTIDLGSTTHIGSVSLKYRELFDDWGSWLSVAIDGVASSGVGPSSCAAPCFDAPPSFNSRMPDSSYSEITFPVDVDGRVITIAVSDITLLSEMYIDDLSVLP